MTKHDGAKQPSTVQSAEETTTPEKGASSPLELYFFRHGPAGSASAWHGDDAERPLTDKGRELTDRVAKRLAEACIEVDLVITSPYVRAVQTAEIAAAALGVKRSLEVDSLLEPGFDVAALERILGKYSDVKRVMVVGHQSDFSIVIGQLIGSADLVVRKAGVAMVELPEPGKMRGTLRFLAPPSLLA